MRKIIAGFYILLMTFMSAPGVLAATQTPAAVDPTVNVYLFSREGCPHCAALKRFLEAEKKKGLKIVVKEYEVIKSKDNAELLQRVAETLNIQISGVPFTVVGNRSMIGYSDDQTSGVELMKMIKNQALVQQPDIIALLESGKKVLSPETGEAVKVVKIPFWGLVDVRQISLPILTVVLGGLDSLNPCAMWVLLFLIGVLFKVQSRKRQWLLGWVFLGSSAAAYFVFMAAWLNVYMFLGYLDWIRLGVALVAITVGVIGLRDFWQTRSGCEIAENETRRKLIIGKIKQFAQHKSFPIALFGLAAVAVGVNLIELLCSAGLPAVYVPVLISAKLPIWQYYSYLLLYVFFYILPQLVVFLLAMLTMRQVAIDSRFTRWFGLASGVLMLILGLMMAFKPEWLTFSF